MWTRKLLKDNAKHILRRSYAVALAVCALAGAIGAGLPNRQNPYFFLLELQQMLYHTGIDSSLAFGGFLGDFPMLFASGDYPQLNRLYATYSAGLALAFFGIFAAVAACLFSSFISMPLAVGKNRAFLENRAGAPGFSGLLFPFKSNYLRIVGGMLTTKLFMGLPILLAYLVFVVLGVMGALTYPVNIDILFAVLLGILLVGGAVSAVLAYRWRLVPWLMAENPFLTGTQARQISAAVTRGEKWNIFVLDLSFLGWAILALIPLGWGFLLLNPYIEATNAELYAALRAKALARNICTAQQLPGVLPAYSWPVQPPKM